LYLLLLGKYYLIDILQSGHLVLIVMREEALLIAEAGVLIL
jgi:hypothetical protein